MWPWHSPIWDSPSCRATLRAGCLSQRHLVLTATALPSTAAKANTRDAGADERKGVYSGAGHLEGGGLVSQSPSFGTMGDSHLKAHLPLSVEAEVFIRTEGNRTKRSREGVAQFSTGRRTQSIPMRQVMARCVSRLHVILAPWLKVSKSPRAGMPEDPNLYLLKLVPRIPTQTCCLSIRYRLVRVHTYRNSVKRMLRWVIISHHYILLGSCISFGPHLPIGKVNIKWNPWKSIFAEEFANLRGEPDRKCVHRVLTDIQIM